MVILPGAAITLGNSFIQKACEWGLVKGWISDFIWKKMLFYPDFLFEVKFFDEITEKLIQPHDKA